MNMNPEIKAEWVKRLRSGDYEQCVGFLNRSDKYCCWGVLCEIAAEAGVITKETGRTLGGRITRYADESTTPPFQVIEWAGIGNVASSISEIGYVSPITANDTLNWDFKQIADGIERLW